MTGTGPASRFRAMLISMPWALFNRPSLQLAALKAYVEREMEAEILTCHPFLDVAAAIGIDAYRRISASSWAGEALFAPLLFPGQRHKARDLFNSSLNRPAAGERRLDYDELVPRIAEACDNWLARNDLSGSRLIGFSVCFGQLLPSLHLSRRIREQGIDATIVFGGSSCCSDTGRALLRHFPWIDHVVDGEGEQALLGLCRCLAKHAAELPTRVLSRDSGPSPCPRHQLESLDSLPTPDYRPYFTQIKTLFQNSPFIPVLPVEFSRGCWWNKCTFCNLNLQWQGYRCKSAERMISEVDSLSREYQCLDFTFTDNALPVRQADRFFQRQRQLRQDRRFFAEIRATCENRRLVDYARGGLHTIQVGIESLSNSLLRKMAKGASVIDNIAIMKHSAAAGIRLEGNLILEFPGSDAAEVAQTLANLDFVLPFSPLDKAVFFLGAGSPVHRSPREYGISGLIPHRRNMALMPPEIARDIGTQVMDYRGGRCRQRRLWRPVADRIDAWHAFHRQRQTATKPALSYRDGGDFLIIRQERIDGPPLQHRLRGLSREIYLHCDQIRTGEQLQRRFPRISAASLEHFLDDLHRKRLLFRDGERVLALAIRQRS